MSEWLIKIGSVVAFALLVLSVLGWMASRHMAAVRRQDARVSKALAEKGARLRKAQS